MSDPTKTKAKVNEQESSELDHSRADQLGPLPELGGNHQNPHQGPAARYRFPYPTSLMPPAFTLTAGSLLNLSIPPNPRLDFFTNLWQLNPNQEKMGGFEPPQKKPTTGRTNPAYEAAEERAQPSMAIADDDELPPKRFAGADGRWHPYRISPTHRAFEREIRQGIIRRKVEAEGNEADGQPLPLQLAHATHRFLHFKEATGPLYALSPIPQPSGLAALFEGRSTAFLAQFREFYMAAFSIYPEYDIWQYAATDDRKAILARLWPLLPPLTKVEMSLDINGWGQTVTAGVPQVLETMDRAELSQLRAMPGAWDAIWARLTPREAARAAAILFPDRHYETTLQLITHSYGWLGNDMEAIYTAILQLSATDRQRLITADRAILSKIPGYTDTDLGLNPLKPFARVVLLCRADEATALRLAASIATWGPGTYDDLLAAVAQGAAKAKQEIGKAQAGLNGTPEQQQQAREKLSQLGEVDTLTADGSTFLDDLAGDLSPEEFAAYAQRMGVSPEEAAKRRIQAEVGMTGGLLGDKEAIFSTLLSLPAEARLAVAADPRTQQAIVRVLGPGDIQRLMATIEGDPYRTALETLRSAATAWLDLDEALVHRTLLAMEEGHRQRIQKEEPELLQNLRNRMGNAGKQALQEILDTGRLSTRNALTAGAGGSNDGTDEAVITQAMQRMEPRERAMYRLGFALHQGYEVPQGQFPEKHIEQARSAYYWLHFQIHYEMTHTERMAVLSAMLETPAPEEYGTPHGMELTAYIGQQWNILKGQYNNGSFGDRLTGLFAGSGTAALVAEIAAGGKYEEFRNAGEGEERQEAFMQHAALSQDFRQRMDEFNAHQRMVAEVAATVATVAAAILVTAATGGAGAPAGLALLSNLGSLGTAIIAATVTGLTRVAVMEAVLDEDFDATGTEGAQQFGGGAVEGFSAVLTMGLGGRLMQGFQRLASAGGTAKAMAALALESADGAASTAGWRITKGAIEEAVEGAIGGAASEMALTLLDEKTWSQTVWQVLTTLGRRTLGSAALGFGTGMATGGAIRGMGEAKQRGAGLTPLEIGGQVPGTRQAMDTEAAWHYGLGEAGQRFRRTQQGIQERIDLRTLRVEDLERETAMIRAMLFNAERGAGALRTGTRQDWTALSPKLAIKGSPLDFLLRETELGRSLFAIVTGLTDRRMAELGTKGLQLMVNRAIITVDEVLLHLNRYGFGARYLLIPEISQVIRQIIADVQMEGYSPAEIEFVQRYRTLNPMSRMSNAEIRAARARGMEISERGDLYTPGGEEVTFLGTPDREGKGLMEAERMEAPLEREELVRDAGKRQQSREKWRRLNEQYQADPTAANRDRKNREMARVVSGSETIAEGSADYTITEGRDWLTDEIARLNRLKKARTAKGEPTTAIDRRLAELTAIFKGMDDKDRLAAYGYRRIYPLGEGSSGAADLDRLYMAINDQGRVMVFEVKGGESELGSRKLVNISAGLDEHLQRAQQMSPEYLADIVLGMLKGEGETKRIGQFLRDQLRNKNVDYVLFRQKFKEDGSLGDRILTPYSLDGIERFLD